MLSYIYEKRPFKTRNAEEYSTNDVLKLFIPPQSGVANPFEFENSIIRGRMGSGKTMYLKANEAFYLHSLIPNLINNAQIILPVFIRLNDFQQIRDPHTIYKNIIIRITEELCETFLQLRDSERLADIHNGVQRIPDALLRKQKFGDSLMRLKKLTSQEYTETIERAIQTKGSATSKVIDLSLEYKKGDLLQIRQKSDPSIRDIELCYRSLLKTHDVGILLLIDEAGSICRDFFRSSENEDSMFEILMNQFRTSSYIRTKVAVYPNSFQDTLTAHRYGDLINLEDDIETELGYANFRFKTENLVWSYLNNSVREDPNKDLEPNDVFEFSDGQEHGDAIEQLINASGGNMRRLIYSLDKSMQISFARQKGEGRVSLDDATNTLIDTANKMVDSLSMDEKTFLIKVTKACRSRSTYKFRLPNHSTDLNRLCSRQQEGNIIRILQIGSGRRGALYAFDYCYCVSSDIPTHNIKDTDRIDKARSFEDGERISKVTQLSSEIVQHSEIDQKIEGTITFSGRRDTGFITGSDNKEYAFFRDLLIESDRKAKIHAKKRVRFIPMELEGTQIATEIELL